MKILVTGSSGFIGFHVAKKLLEKGYQVHGIDNHNDYYSISLKETRKKILEHLGLNFQMLDINDISQLTSNFDLVINLAAQAGVRVPKEKEYLYKHSNIEGFKSVCDFCNKRNINKLIYASSSSVYSDVSKGKFKESSTQLVPKSEYGRSKLKNEEFANYFSTETNIKMIGLRFFSVYGPYGRPDMAYYLFSESIMNNKPIKLNNDGLMLRDMTYIDDVVDGIIGSVDFICSKKCTIKNELFNLGNDRPVSTKELLRILEFNLRKKTKKIKFETKNESLFTHADISRAKNLLGYNPKVSLEEGIKKFLNWYLNYENF